MDVFGGLLEILELLFSLVYGASYDRVFLTLKYLNQNQNVRIFDSRYEHFKMDHFHFNFGIRKKCLLLNLAPLSMISRFVAFRRPSGHHMGTMNDA